jgi:hypothetical protein
MKNKPHIDYPIDLRPDSCPDDDYVDPHEGLLDEIVRISGASRKEALFSLADRISRIARCVAVLDGKNRAGLKAIAQAIVNLQQTLAVYAKQIDKRDIAARWEHRIKNWAKYQAEEIDRYNAWIEQEGLTDAERLEFDAIILDIKKGRRP